MWTLLRMRRSLFLLCAQHFMTSRSAKTKMADFKKSECWSWHNVHKRTVSMYSGQISYSRAMVCGPAAFSSWASCTRAHRVQHQWHSRSLKNVPCEEKRNTIINMTWVALYCRISNSSAWPFQPCWLFTVCVALRLTSIPFISRILPRITAPQ